MVHVHEFGYIVSFNVCLQCCGCIGQNMYITERQWYVCYDVATEVKWQFTVDYCFCVHMQNVCMECFHAGLSF